MTDPHQGVAAGSSAQHYAAPPRIVEPGVPADHDYAGRATTTEEFWAEAVNRRSDATPAEAVPGHWTPSAARNEEQS